MVSLSVLALLVVIGAGQVPIEPMRSSTNIGSHDVSRYEVMYGEPMYSKISSHGRTASSGGR